MSVSKQVAIIQLDTLQTLGIQFLLSDYFAPVEIETFSMIFNLQELNIDNYDLYITSSDCFILNADFFLPRKNRTVVVVSNKLSFDSAIGNVISVNASQEEFIEMFQAMFKSDLIPESQGKGLSLRETDVLTLIVKGKTNKEIADDLNISLNTVLSHRKNITTKLGIKTVPGLTFYAIMNGIITGDSF